MSTTSRENGDDDREPAQAWLLAREQGKSLPPPEADDLRVYDALCRNIGELPLAPAPPALRDRVRAALDAEAAARPAAAPRPVAARGRWRSAWPAMAAAVAAAAAVLLWFGRGSPAPAPGDELAVSVRRGDDVRRSGDTAALGDVLDASLRVDGAAQLRVYRGERTLVVRCPGGAGCKDRDLRGQPGLSVAVPLDSLERYRVVAFVGGAKDPSTGSLDGDLAEARTGGARVLLGATVDVH